jgi:BirA family biotin operon repressor/biotin-[acetyl-CoA-carboxylase] ligase
LGERLDWDIREYECIDSTNLEARRLLEGGAGAGLVVWARHQTAGRGRMHRTWFDLPGKSLMASMVVEGKEGFRAGILLALSIREAVKKEGGEGPRFKWPNDLVYGWRKVGGILCESCRVGDGNYVIAGLGVNVGYSHEELDFPSKLKATSLLIEEGRLWDPGNLLLSMLKEAEVRWGWEDELLLEEYRRHLAFVGERVRVNPPLSFLNAGFPNGQCLEGIVEGVDREGHLLLKVEDLVLRMVSGDLVEP